ncbi:hypothetical protein ALC60_12297 [Trachymyrmex zeteki]|uniref:Uncharacterized protein n=1 Tax=Mycetomoellerius zeteki TaxID=64791 RepID=A0A151WLC1_9HYME|nr:hypothetical protein ALC60_12297 [Trachymyrmex zeteki]
MNVIKLVYILFLQLVMGDVIQNSQSTISRIIFRVTCLIAQLNGMLVGNAGYPSLPFLLTPINNLVADDEIRFV